MTMKSRPGNACQAGDGSGGGSAAPLFVHFVGGVDAEFEKVRAGIGERGNAFASREAVLFVLRFDGLAPPPWRIFSSSFLMVVRSSTMRWEFFSKSGDFALIAVSEPMRTRGDLADRSGGSGISIRRIGGMCE